MRRHRLVVLALALLLFAAACGDAEEGGSVGAGSRDASSEDGAGDGTQDSEAPTEEQTVSLVKGDAGVKVTGEAGQAPVITVPGGEPPTELHYADLAEGTGEQAQAGATVTTHYKGVLWADGKEFDASFGGNPATFSLDGVIAGWTHGIPGMKVGGRRLLVIPSDLAYGEGGYPPVIPPNAALVFVIDLVSLS